MAVPTFADAPLLDVLAHVEAALAAGATELRFRVLDPDLGRGRFAGERVEIDGVAYVHRPLRAWVDLADRRGLRLCTPRAAPSPLIELRFERLAEAVARTPNDPGADPRERYGAGSPFARIAKLEEPAFVLDLVEALGRVALAPDARVLDLGVGRGDDLALLEAVVPGFAARGELVGVDHSASALAVARRRAGGARTRFVEADLASLPTLGLGAFDLVLSIATLQSPGIDDREVLRQIVQRHLAPGGAVILGVPNCRYLDGEVRSGARVRNLRQAELGLLVKDVAFFRRYLQQHRKTVYVTGTDHVFVTAVERTGPPG